MKIDSILFYKHDGSSILTDTFKVCPFVFAEFQSYAQVVKLCRYLLIQHGADFVSASVFLDNNRHLLVTRSHFVVTYCTHFVQDDSEFLVACQSDRDIPRYFEICPSLIPVGDIV